MRLIFAFAVAVCAQPALAETADQVWEDWRNMAAVEGWFIKQATPTPVANGLKITGLVMAQNSGSKLVIPELVFTELAGGAVDVTFAPEIDVYKSPLPVTFAKLKIPGAVLHIDKNGLEEGWSFAADAVAFAAIPDADPEMPGVTAELSWQKVKAVYAIGPVDALGLKSAEVTLHTGEMHLEMASRKIPENLGVWEVKVPALDLLVTAKLPKDVFEGADISTEEAMALGFEFGITLLTEPLYAYMNYEATDFYLNGLGSSTVMAMDGREFSLRYEFGDGKLRSVKAGEDELGASWDSLVTQVTGPVNSMDVPGTLNLLWALKGLQVNDAIWAQVDAGNVLPHDPMNLVIDLAMKARWNIFEEATTEDFEPESVDLRQLEMNVAGVAASFSGHGTVDPAAPEDQPFKEGVLDGKVRGLNRLLDALVEAGMFAAGDLFPVRAGLSMVFNPVTGPDDLTTHVEQKADGSVFVNGVQMK